MGQKHVRDGMPLEPPGAAEDWLSQLPPGSLVLGAVSGGADSTYLAYHLAEVLPMKGHRLALIHVNHGTRGAENSADEEHVRALAELLRVTVHVHRLDPGETRTADEGQLRELRLGALKEAARSLAATAIAFGHHADDLAETFLLNAMRGSGLAGLEGMRRLRRLPGGLLLLRPLLHRTRGEIRRALEQRGVGWREDCTNSDVRFRRNALRKQVMPALEQVEPASIANMAFAAQLAGEVLGFVEEKLEEMLPRFLVRGTRRWAMLDRENLIGCVSEGTFPLVLRLVVQRLLQVSEPGALPGRADLMDIQKHVYTKQPGERTWEGGHVDVWTMGSLLMVYQKMGKEAALWEARGCFPGFYAQEAAEVELPGEGSVEIGDLLVSCSAATVDGVPTDTGTTTLRGVQFPLVLCRAALDGRVQLPTGSKAVRDCLREAGVPPSLRESVLCIRDREKVVWIPGIRQDAGTVVRDGERAEVRINVGRREPGDGEPGDPCIE